MQLELRTLVILCAAGAAVGSACGEGEPSPPGDLLDSGHVGGVPDGSGIPPQDDAAAGEPADAAPGTPDAAPVPGCAASAWTPGTTKTVELAHGGLTRKYTVHVGSSAPVDTPTPVLFSFHGLTSNAWQQQWLSQGDKSADDNGFIVVYPEGVQASFNAEGCCGQAAQQGIDDVGFARAIVDDVAANVCIDRKRVYATGMSNGGFMSFRLACSAADVFAAIAPVAGALPAACAPARPVPVIAFHGDADNTVSYASGQAAVATFRTKNGCTGEPTRTMYGSAYCDRWTACNAGVTVELCSFPGFGHWWPGTAQGRAATPAMWEFLSQYSLP